MESLQQSNNHEEEEEEAVNFGDTWDDDPKNVSVASTCFTTSSIWRWPKEEDEEQDQQEQETGIRIPITANDHHHHHHHIQKTAAADEKTTPLKLLLFPKYIYFHQLILEHLY
jgi:hypothetical protein